MRLNDIKPGVGSRRRSKRRGRGAGSGNGKTAGRGHKGQKSRAGGGVRKGFEGGQMPLQRRLPKFGFVSRKSLLAEKIRINALDGIEEPVVTLKLLRKCGLIAKRVKYAKLFGDAQLSRAYTVRGIAVSKGARASIESIGGKVED